MVFANQSINIDPVVLIFILILAFLSIVINFKIINFEQINIEEQIYLLLNFFGFFILYNAFANIMNNVEYGLGFTLILISEAFFWSSLKFILTREKVRKYDDLISYINTSLVGLIYLFFIIFLLFLNKFSISEASIYILATLLLISIFKNIYGIFTNANNFNFIQLHIYSYIFLFFSIVLSMNAIEKSFLFSITSYLIGLYSANEISNITNSKFNINIFKFWIFFIFLGAFILMLVTSKITPLLPLGSIGLLIAFTLVKINQKSFDENTQGILLLSIIFCSFILYVLTGKIFLIEQLGVIVNSIK